MNVLTVKYKSPEWFDLRQKHLGGSEAAAAVGLSPFMSVSELWEEKTGRRPPQQILDNDRVNYGTNAEAPLATLFTLDFPQFAVTSPKDIVFIDGYREASLDLLLERKDDTKEQGFAEIKTATDIGGSAKKKWANNAVPEHYYCQALHYFLVNEQLKFAYFKAQIKYCGGELPFIETIHRYITRAEVAADIEILRKKEDEFWWFVEHNKKPHGKLFI